MAVDFTQSQQMNAMLPPQQEKLKKYTPEQLCQKAGITYNETTQTLTVPSLNKDIHIHYPDITVDWPVEHEKDMWYIVTLLIHLDEADGLPLADTTKSLADMPGGMARASGFERQYAAIFTKDFATATAAQVKAAVEKLGGTITQGKGDVCATLYFAPKMPVYFSFYEADDEFPASGKLLVNGYAEHNLNIEATGFVLEYVLYRISQELA